MKVDSWVWGNEQIIWGFDRSHQYTAKVLMPKRGRLGCLSLQYHHHKSESWIGFRGIAWALVIVGDAVCTMLLRPGNILNLPTGTIHRLMGCTDDVQVIEPSTPDRHAADPTVPKDVVRLHCTQGRPVASARDERERVVVAEAIRITEEAIAALERGELPREYAPDRIPGRGRVGA